MSRLDDIRILHARWLRTPAGKTYLCGLGGRYGRASRDRAYLLALVDGLTEEIGRIAVRTPAPVEVL